MKTQDFIDKIAPHAIEDMKKNGVLASVTLAQAILESAWGISELAVNARNLFGMKANLSGNTWQGSAWDGTIYKKNTGEQLKDGQYITVLADFRAYEAIEDSIADHSAYLLGAMNGTKHRYEGLKDEKDARTAITIIKNGGYATSLEYVDKVMNLIEKYNLTNYDKNTESEAAEEMKAVKIMLDAGHYGKYNQSPANKSYYESDFTWKFHILLKAELERRGFTVGATRAAQASDLALNSRGRAAAGYDLFISIHSNAVGSGVNNSVDYPVAITMVNDESTTIDEASKKAGEALVAAVAASMGTKQAARTYTKQSVNDRDGNGILDDEYYGVLNGAKQAGVAGLILEHSFHTNATATAWLLIDSNLQDLAEVEADALAKVYGVSTTTTPGQTEATMATWYRVRKAWSDAASQIGAYQVYDNAVKNCPTGYSVFDEAGKALYTNAENQLAENEWYRVRKSWDDAASQTGAYRVYDNAVNNCKTGYAVYDDAGNILYRNVAATTYKVKAGDTLGAIALANRTTVEAIVAANKTKYPKIAANYILVGWNLMV